MVPLFDKIVPFEGTWWDFVRCSAAPPLVLINNISDVPFSAMQMCPGLRESLGERRQKAGPYLSYAEACKGQLSGGT